MTAITTSRFESLDLEMQVWFTLASLARGAITIDIAEQILEPLINDDTHLQWPYAQTTVVRLPGT
jgi:macrodomain Ter protein organizer (MatP/YcbG family)